jgi:hypothetical protein
MYRYRFFLIMVLALTLFSCSSSPDENAIQTAIAQTALAKPTSTFSPINTPLPTQSTTTTTQPTEIIQPSPTATRIPLNEIDLKQILVPSAEMPNGYIGSKTQDTLPNLDVPKPLSLIWQQLETEKDIVGGIRIYLYESKFDVQKAYETETESFLRIDPDSSIADVGDMAAMVSFHAMGGTDTTNDLAFIRCMAVVSIRMINAPRDVIIQYAQSIDQRIQNIICR